MYLRTNCTEEKYLFSISAYGITTIASDWCAKLTVHSGMPCAIHIKPMPPKPKLENKIYVAFILSDVPSTHLYTRENFANPGNGKCCSYVMAYPNPVQTNLYVDNLDDCPLEMVVLNMVGGVS